MKATYENLIKLENQINRLYCKNPKTFLESKMGIQYRIRWEAMMIELRGWGTSNWENGANLTNQSWLDYCVTDIYPYYNFGDVCA